MAIPSLLRINIFISYVLPLIMGIKNIGSQNNVILRDFNYIPHAIDSNEKPTRYITYELVVKNCENKYLLFTRNNRIKGQILEISNSSTIKISNFNASIPTLVLVHGWNGDFEADFNKRLTKGFLQKDDLNVIVVGWKMIANRNYVTAKRGVLKVGKMLAQFLIWLTKFGLRYEMLHLVGFSLGGHVIGIASRTINGRAKRITALDPAGPLWYHDSNRLAKDDAEYVEVIHTNAGVYGYSEPCGDADFYPNGGSHMPGCINNVCSHGRAYEYMVATVKLNHISATKCCNLEEMQNDECLGERVHLGNSYLNKSVRGIYRVNTSKKYPFYKIN